MLSTNEINALRATAKKYQLTSDEVVAMRKAIANKHPDQAEKRTLIKIANRLSEEDSESFGVTMGELKSHIRKL